MTYSCGGVGGGGGGGGGEGGWRGGGFVGVGGGGGGAGGGGGGGGGVRVCVDYRHMTREIESSFSWREALFRRVRHCWGLVGGRGKKSFFAGLS